MWDIKDNNTRPTDLLPEILQMAKLELINSKIMTQDTMTGSFIGLNPLRDPCHGDSGEIFTWKHILTFFRRQAVEDIVLQAQRA